MVAVRSRLDDDKAAATCVLLPNQGQARRRLIVPLDNHVLKQIAETGFDRALVSAVDLEEVRDRALLTDVPVGLHQHHPRGIAEVGATGGQLLERREAPLDRGEFLFARAQVARALFVLALRHRELRAPLRQLLADSLERGLRLRVRVRRRRAIGLDFFAFAPHVILFDVQARQLSRRRARAACRCAPSRAARSSSHWTIGRNRCESLRHGLRVPRSATAPARSSALADAITSPASSLVRSMSTAASRRASSARRAGSRRASSSWISAAMSRPRPSSVSTCWRLNSCCC